MIDTVITDIIFEKYPHKNSKEDILNYIYKNSFYEKEWDRKNSKKIIKIENELIGKNVEEAIEYLQHFKDNKNLKFEKNYYNYGDYDIVLIDNSHIESDEEYAHRLYYNVIILADVSIKKLSRL